MQNKKTVILSFNGISTEHPLSSKSLNSLESLTNKINLLKYNFANQYITNQWLDQGKITLENNCSVNEQGKHIPHLVRTSLTETQLDEFEFEVNKIIPNIQNQLNF